MERPDLDAIDAGIAYDSVGTRAGVHLYQVITYARDLEARIVELETALDEDCASCGWHDPRAGRAESSKS